MAVTLSQIAEACDLSAVTVSVILRNPEDPRYSQQTKERVLEAAKRMHYVPNFAARSLRKGRSMMIAMVIPWNNTELMDEVQRATHEAGYGLIVEFTPYPNLAAESKALEIALSRQVDGLIWMPTNQLRSMEDVPAVLRGQLSRTVMLGYTREVPAVFNRVYIDYRKDLDAAVAYLAAGGCEEVVMVSLLSEALGMNYVPHVEASCKKRGLLFSRVTETAEQNLTDGTIRHLKGTRRRVGIFGTDLACVEVLPACVQLKRKIPRDLEILAYCDLLFGGRHRLNEIATPPLSAIRVPFGELGRQAVQRVVEMQGKEPAEPVSVRLSTEFIERESTVPRASLGMFAKRGR